MYRATVTLKGFSPYAQNGFIKTPKLPKESADDYERRTWRDRCSTDKEGFIVIRGVAIKNCLSEIAKHLARQVPGRGKKTFKDFFVRGVMVEQDFRIHPAVKKEDVEPFACAVPSDGVVGSGKRVLKFFPRIEQWSVDAEILILDETITKEVFVEHLAEAGKFVGLGWWRPERNGTWGRFVFDDLKWVRE